MVQNTSYQRRSVVENIYQYVFEYETPTFKTQNRQQKEKKSQYVGSICNFIMLGLPLALKGMSVSAQELAL